MRTLSSKALYFVVLLTLHVGCGPDVVAGRCASDEDCSSNETCRNENCVIVADGCSADEDCASGQVCRAGDCIVQEENECVTDDECAPNETCREGSCVPSSACAGDADGDGFGVGCEPGPDCDDADNAVHSEVELFVDADNDGVSIASSALVCVGDSGTRLGYTNEQAQVPDCDDNDPQAFVVQEGYLDEDEDGAATSTLVSVCTGERLPGNVVADAPAIPDCDDSDAARRPGGREFCDGIDNNCNEVKDEEGCPCTRDVRGDKVYLRCDAPVFWTDANDLCNALPSYSLVTIESDVENIFINSFRAGRTPWLGLMRDDANADFEWVDGSQISYSGFAPGQPQGIGSRRCARIAAEGWSDSICTLHNPFICESNQNDDAPTGPCSDADGDGYGLNCNAGVDCDDSDPALHGLLAAFTDHDEDAFTSRSQTLVCAGDEGLTPPFSAERSFTDDCDDSEGALTETCVDNCTTHVRGNRSYAFCNALASWPAARTLCQDRGGDLASFEEVAEYLWFAREALEQDAGPLIWMGLTDEAIEGREVWISTDQRAGYGRFQGSLNSPERNCGHFSSTGWKMEECNQPLRYVCESPL